MSKHSDQNEQAGWRWWIVFILAPIAISLGTIGYWFSNGSVPGINAWLDALYRSLQLLLFRMTPVNTIHWTLDLARWLAAAVFGLATVLAFIRVFRSELRQIRLQIPWPRHVVILGLGPMTTQLVQCFRGKGRRVVVVAPMGDAKGAEVCRANGATLVTGELADPATLVKARVYWASHVLALTEEDNTNIAIAYEVRKLILQKTCRCNKQPLVNCFVHLSDVDARTSLRASAAFGGICNCPIHFFDLFDAAARELLLGANQMPLDRGGIGKDDPRQVHLVILGFGRMGQTVALRAAQLAHFANRKPLQISVIDQQAKKREQSLLFRYPNFKKTCQIEFYELSMESLSAREMVEAWGADKTKVVSIATCFDQDALALEVALRMKSNLDLLQVPMFVRMSSRAGFASVLQGDTPDPASHVHAFGMVEDCCRADLLENMLNEKLAQAIHEDYRVEKREDMLRKGGDPDKDISTKMWNELNDGLKDSNRQQADHIDIKLRAIGLERVAIADPRPPVERFGLDDVELLAEMEHNRWNAERWLQGWTLGSSNKPHKVTPYLVPWNQLSNDIQEYDRQTVRKIPAFLAINNQKACRRS
jgi:hypothetical protein